MKRLLAATFFILFAMTLWSATMMSIQVSAVQLRDKPGFRGIPGTELNYGDRVEVVEEGRGWFKVRSGSGESGWIQESALTTKEVVLQAGAAVSSGASTEEVALAGKGFSEDVEREYRDQSDLEAEFKLVDLMESYERPDQELLMFLDDGRLEGVVE